MTNAVRATATTRVPMDPMRKTALVAGLFYLITFISIPTLALYSTLKSDPAWILGSGSVTGVLLGTVLELIVALAGIGTAVALFPVVRRQSEGFALGFVTTRIVEAAMIFTGVVSLLSLVTLQQDLGAAAGAADAPSLVTTGASLTATYNWTFTVGQSLMPGFNALLLGTLLYRSGLVPRALPDAGTHRGPHPHHRHRPDDLRRRRAVLRAGRARGTPDRRVGVLARPLPDLQGLQGLCADHGGSRCQVGRPDGSATAARSQAAVTTAGAA